MKFLLGCVAICFVTSFSFSQATAVNRLEMYYSQGLYKKVYRYAGKLMDSPENDYTKVPAFYRAISTFQLSGKKIWLKTHPNAVKDAGEIYWDLLHTSDGQAIIENHLTEISELKKDLTVLTTELKRKGRDKEADQYQIIISKLFNNVPVIVDEIVTDETPLEKNTEFTFNAKNRDEIVLYAKTLLGKPYLNAGETPSGFDCSGFTGYVMKSYKVELPRSSKDQFDKAKKISASKVQKGDLVFFDSGSGVNHVGMIISEQGQNPVMIHSSTSKGIIITDINSSAYWVKRVKGYGTFLE